MKKGQTVFVPHRSTTHAYMLFSDSRQGHRKLLCERPTHSALVVNAPTQALPGIRCFLSWAFSDVMVWLT